MAACESFSRIACTWPSAVSSLMPAGIACSTLPLGPSTTIVLPVTVYFTPLGSGIGFFSIRHKLLILKGLRVPAFHRSTAARQEVSRLYNRSKPKPTAWKVLLAPARKARKARVPPTRGVSPDFAQDFAAYAFAARLASGHHTLGRGEDADAESALHALDLIAAEVNAAAGARDAGEVADRCFVVCAIFQVNAQHVAAILFRGLVVGDIALFLQDAGDLGLQLGGRNVELLVPRADGIADAGKEVCYRIGQTHRFSFIPRSLCREGR